MSFIDRSGADAVIRTAVGGDHPSFSTLGERALAEIAEAPLRGMLTLRGDLASSAVASCLEAVYGAALDGAPAVPLTRKARFLDEERAIWWMSPDELLLMTPYGLVGEALSRGSAALGSAHTLLVDVSDARQTFTIRGARARELLAKGAPIDLHPQSFAPGDARRTRLGQIAAGIAMTGADPDAFEVIVFRSYAAHLWTWLQAAAAPGSEVDLF